MSTKKETIEDAVYEEVNETTEKVNYVVELELSENFLEKNPTIKSIYDKGKMSIGLLPNVDKEFVEKIISLIPELNSKELVLFNPLIEAINTLASQDFISEEPVPKRMDYEEDKDFNKRKKEWLESEYRKFTDLNKSIGAFNTALKTSKKTMKDPILERSRQIDALYNSLTAFSENRKEVARNNFPKYLIAQQKIKEAQEAKKNAAALAEKQALETANAEAAQKIETLTKKSSYADLVTDISTYFNGKSTEVDTLNYNGLELLKQEVTDKTFDFSNQGELEQANLLASVKMFRTSIISQIEKAMESTTSPSVPDPDPVQEKPVEEKKVESVEDNFIDIIHRLNNVNTELDCIEKFQDPKFEKVNEKFFEQIEIMRKTGKACVKYITTIQEKYNKKSK